MIQTWAVYFLMGYPTNVSISQIHQVVSIKIYSLHTIEFYFPPSVFVTQFYKTVDVCTFFKIHFNGFLFSTGKDESAYQVIA